MKTELAALVEAEARLDRELAEARATAAALEESARERAEAAAAALASELASQQARVAAEIERDTQERVRAIEEAANRDIARFAAIDAERADALARELADRLTAFSDEVPP